MKSLIILGRQPKIGLAEIESLYGTEKLTTLLPHAALLDIHNKDIVFNRLGGSMKLGNIISKISYNDKDLAKNLIKILLEQQLQNDRKIKLGFSFYGFNYSVNKINALGLSVKKALKNKGFSVRLIPNRDTNLNAAQILNNKLTKDNGFELLLVLQNNDIYIARTTAVQDIDEYTARDRQRPKRDSYVGMLPPKLAQIIVNLASGPININININNQTLLDPFCGTGVILQEALLMGFDAYGTDIMPKMVDYSKTNIDWLKNYWLRVKNDCLIELGDATKHKWSKKIDLVASETYLGKPLTFMPETTELNMMISQIDKLHRQFLINIQPQITPNTRLCLAIPAWNTKSGFKQLPILDQLEDLGYNRVAFENANNNDLIYYRPDQLVARSLITLIRK